MSRYLKSLLFGAAMSAAAIGAALPFRDQVVVGTVDAGPSTKRAMGSVERSYVENKGQWNSNALLVTRAPGLDFWVTRTGIVLDAYQNVDKDQNGLVNTLRGSTVVAPDYRQGHVVRMNFVGARGTKSYVGSNPISTRIEYVPFGKPVITGVKGFGEVTVQQVLPGVNARFYRENDVPRYDLILAPGTKPTNVAFAIEGADRVEVTEDGTLRLATTVGWLSKADLFVYQDINGKRVQVPASFSVEETKSGFSVGFELGKFDPTRPVVIDPLVYGTHFGGDFGEDEVVSATSDGAGNTYFTGWTNSIDLPIITGPYGVELKDSTDAYVAQLTGDVYDAEYIAYMGTGFEDSGKQVQVDQYGNLWAAGWTFSDVFPGRIDVTIGVPQGANAPWGGNFTISYAGIETANIAYNATANDIQTALNALANIPVGGFTVTPVDANGNPLPPTSRLPGTRMRIVATDPAAGALRLVTRRRPYRVIDAMDPLAPGPAANQILAVDFTAQGFSPRAGTFTLSVVDGGTPATTGNIRFDANGGEVQTALRAIPFLTGTAPARVTATGGRLVFPLTEPVNAGIPVAVGFFDTASAPQLRPLMTANNANVDYGTLTILNQRAQAFLTLFRKTPAGITAADSNPANPAVTRMIRGVTPPVPNTTGITPAFFDNSVTGLALRRITTSTGLVEIAIAGNAAGNVTIARGDNVGAPVAMPGTVPTGTRFGYFATFTFNNTTGAMTLDTNRSGYIGGTGRTTVDGVAMDAEGSVYLAGGLDFLLPTGFATNVSLSPTSPVFRTTAGGYPNSSLLRFKDAWIRKIGPTGTLLISSVLGGSQYDKAEGIAVDQNNNIYVLSRTNSFNFPRTVNSFSEFFPGGGTLLAITKISSTGATIAYSTSLATSARSVDDVTPPFIPAPNSRFDVYDIAVDQKGNAYVSGLVTRPMTGPIPMPITPVAPVIADQLPALDNVLPNGDTDGFLTVLNSTGTGLLYSSVIGEVASADWANGVFVDRTGAVYVSGASLVTALGPIGLPSGYLSPFSFKAFPDGADGWMVKLKIIQPILEAIAVTPVDVAGGLGSTAQVQVLLQRPAPVGGATVTLRISNPSVARFVNAVSGPTNVRVTIPQGQQLFSAPVPVFTRLVSNPTSVDIRAELDGDFVQTRLNVRPWMESFTLGTTSVAGGEIINGTVTIFQNAPAEGVTVQLTADSPLVSLPAGGTVTIPAGSRSVSFDIGTSGVDVNTDVNITAAVAGVGVTQTLQLTPPLLESLVISPDRVSGGENTTASLAIEGLAGPNTTAVIANAGGVPVSIIRPGETTPTALPTTVQVPQGQNQVSFTIVTPFLTANGSSVVSATLNGETATDTLFIEAVDIVSVTLDQNPVTGGTLVNGTVTISRPAGLTGFAVPLQNGNPAAGTVTPAIVNIAPGATSGTFTIQTNPSSSPATLTVTASKPGGFTNRSVTLTINPIVVNFAISVTPPIITGGSNALGTISLATPAPINLTFNLSSTDPIAGFTPTNVVTIPAGQLSRTFTITTGITTSIIDLQIQATLFGNTLGAPLRVLPPGIVSFTISPNVVTALNSATATITLDQPAPAGGLLINLTNNNGAFVSHPASITIAGGATTGSFTINTFQVTRQVTVQFSATVPSRGQVVNSLLTINPRP